MEVKAYYEPKEFLSLLAEKLNARIFDMYSETFWTADCTGFSDWKNHCDRIVKDLSYEKDKNK